MAQERLLLHPQKGLPIAPCPPTRYVLQMIWLLLACWRPSPYSPPEVPEEAANALTQLGEEAPEAQEEGGEEGNPDAENPGDNNAGANPDQPADIQEEAEEVPPMEPYRARIITAPASLVDDYGKVVIVLDKPLVEVEVRAEEPIRKKVFCASCKPSGEGWIQAQLVERL